MKKNIIKLLVTTSLSSFAYADTTQNLVSQDFATGWTNTGNTYHGSSVIAGHHDGTVVSDSVSLNAEGINKESLNNGFSVTGSAEVWFWNNYSQSITQTIKTVDDNGEVITQNRTLSGSCATWNGCSFGSMTDTLIIGSNSQQDYNVNLKYSFDVPGTSPAGHLGADLRNPSLTVDYTYVPPLDNATQTALLDLNNDINDDLKDIDNFIFEEEIVIMDTESFGNIEDQTLEEPPLEILSYSDDAFTETPQFETNEPLPTEPEASTEEVLDTTTFTETSEPSDENDGVESQEDFESVSTEDTGPQESQISDQGETVSDNESTTETTEAESSQDTNDKSSAEVKDSSKISLTKTMEKIDAQVKDIGKNLQLKNLVKLKVMIDNTGLESYANVPFYKPKAIYLDQASIGDNRVLYPDSSLVSYTQNDPVYQKEKALFDIRQKKQKLIQELQVLKNG